MHECLSNIDLVVALERPSICIQIAVSDWDSVLTNGIEFGYVNSKHRRDVSPGLNLIWVHYGAKLRSRGH